MILEKMFCVIDPIRILLPEDRDLLVNAGDNYEDTWELIKQAHGITTNPTVSDIFFFHENVFNMVDGHYDNIPKTFETESGFLVGVEFKDLKKLNPDIAPHEMENSLILDAKRASILFGRDDDGEFVQADFVFPNAEYDPNDEESKKTIVIECLWTTDFVPPEPDYTGIDFELLKQANTPTQRLNNSSAE